MPMSDQTTESDIDGQLFDAARNGDLDKLTKLLDAHPEKLDRSETQKPERGLFTEGNRGNEGKKGNGGSSF